MHTSCSVRRRLLTSSMISVTPPWLTHILQTHCPTPAAESIFCPTLTPNEQSKLWLIHSFVFYTQTPLDNLMQSVSVRQIQNFQSHRAG